MSRKNYRRKNNSNPNRFSFDKQEKAIISALDGYSNAAAFLGEDSPLLSAGTFHRRNLTAQTELLTVSYRESWLAKRIIDMPSEDMTRAWYKLASSVSEDDMHDLSRLEAKHSVKQEITNAIRWARLYGGALAVMILRGEEERLDQPLDMDMLLPGCFQGLLVLDRAQGISPSLELVSDLDDPDFGLPMFYVPELKPQLHGSILCAVLGILLITNDHAAFLVMNADVGATINYLSIYSLLPLSIILNNSLNTEHIIPDKIYRQLLPPTTAFFIVVVLLHVTGIAHMNRALFPYYLLAAVGVAIQMPDLIRNLTVKTNPAASRVTMMGLAAVIVCLTVSMIVIFAWRMGLPYVDRETGHNLLPLGAMLFACSQVVNYLSFISESGSRQKDYASLQNIAYADALTGLANRARADKVFEDLDRSREDYCLVSVDVNGLKDTNDRLGHAAGDQLLRDYATALKANFGDEELCARMGGDEFLVVMKRTNADGFGVRLRRLYSDLDEMNAKDKTIFRSAAIGYAFRHECHGGNAHAVYLLADERMFENKREQHIRYRIKDRN